jgi:hypothetical protein
MKVMVSREGMLMCFVVFCCSSFCPSSAHPWIYARSDGLSCGYDVWVGHINRLQLYRTWNRQALNERSFVYFLDTDAGCHDFGGTVGVKCAPYLAPYISATGNNGAEVGFIVFFWKKWGLFIFVVF